MGKGGKEVQKIIKEKDRLEMQAMVIRMQERDRKAKEGNSNNQEDQEDLLKDIPSLRKAARDKYVKERESK